MMRQFLALPLAVERLQKWVHVAEIAGAVSVVASLLYVGYEVRENTDAEGNATEFNLHGITYDLDTCYEDLQFAATMAKANADFSSLTDAERMQVARHVTTGLGTRGNAWRTFRRGKLDESEWIAWDRWFTAEIRTNAWFDVYDRYRYGWVDAFQNHIDSGVGEN